MRILTILFCMLCSYTVFAQETAFVVLDVTGNVTFGKNTKALVGTNIGDNETIIVSKGASVTLACRNSGYARFTNPGKYVVNSATYCKAAPDAAFAKLCNFAWHQFADKEAHDDWRNHLDNLGAATRGAPCNARVDPNIVDIYYCDGDFILSWEPLVPGTELFIKLYKDPNAAPFMQLPLTGNKFSLSQLKGKLKEGNDYYWNIAPKDGFCGETFALHLLTKHDRDSMVAKASNSFKAYISDKAEKQYRLGIALENEHFFADALVCYKEAVKLSPTNKRFSEEVTAFKKRYKMN